MSIGIGTDACGQTDLQTERTDVRKPIGDYSELFVNMADLIHFSILGVSSPYLMYKNTNTRWFKYDRG